MVRAITLEVPEGVRVAGQDAPLGTTLRREAQGRREPAAGRVGTIGVRLAIDRALPSTRGVACAVLELPLEARTHPAIRISEAVVIVLHRLATVLRVRGQRRERVDARRAPAIASDQTKQRREHGSRRTSKLLTTKGSP